MTLLFSGQRIKLTIPGIIGVFSKIYRSVVGFGVRWRTGSMLFSSWFASIGVSTIRKLTSRYNM